MPQETTVKILGESLSTGGHVPLEKGFALNRKTVQADTLIPIGSQIGMPTFFGVSLDWIKDNGKGTYETAPLLTQLTYKDEAGNKTTRQGIFSIEGTMDGAKQFTVTSVNITDASGKNEQTIAVNGSKPVKIKNGIFPAQGAPLAALENEMAAALSKAKPSSLTSTRAPIAMLSGMHPMDAAADIAYQKGKGVVGNALDKALPPLLAKPAKKIIGPDLYSSKDEAVADLGGKAAYGQKLPVANIAAAIALESPTSAYAQLHYAAARLNNTISANHPHVQTDAKGRISLDDPEARKALGAEITGKIAALETGIKDNESNWPDFLRRRFGSQRLEARVGAENELPLFKAAQQELDHFNEQKARATTPSDDLLPPPATPTMARPKAPIR